MADPRGGLTALQAKYDALLAEVTQLRVPIPGGDIAALRVRLAKVKGINLQSRQSPRRAGGGKYHQLAGERGCTI